MRAAILLVALLFSLVLPTHATDVSAVQNVIRAQERAFARSDAAAAYSHAAPAIQEIFPSAEIFMQMVQQGYPPVYRHQSFEFGETKVSGGHVAQRVPSTRWARLGRRSTPWSSSPTAP